MEFNKIIEIYEIQSNNLQKLLETAISKQRSIIQNNRQGLEDFTLKEEHLLNQINKNETARENLIFDFLIENGHKLNEKEKKNLNRIMDSLQNEISSEEYTRLSALRDEMKNRIAAVQEMNYRNMFLIEQANSIVKQTMQVLLKSQTKPIVDRRI